MKTFLRESLSCAIWFFPGIFLGLLVGSSLEHSQNVQACATILAEVATAVEEKVQQTNAAWEEFCKMIYGRACQKCRKPFPCRVGSGVNICGKCEGK